MIEIQNVTTTFDSAAGRFPAVDDVSLHIKRGTIQGIIGFSGAGKSTLLRNINLLERPTSGRVLVDGVDLVTLSDAELRTKRHDIGMIFQHFNLLNNLTAQENVELSLKFAGVGKAERRHRAAETLDIVEVHVSCQALRGPETARSDRPRPGHRAQGAALRRADLGR
ncbi:ATP-binding cassette domain-containing protein [Arthrobacter sp. ov118]|uniref:ATP-binding cassette domain-containing protein n=1 Tax=Arthrobacter sp. ov118 TaxID=1761747 RepID=UPI0008F37D98|nr:ATP-binding cassette domain-containing protein [Arthrobacter sp. ov118]SFT78608.1 ABC transporter [Arthrobacter sp. ov118]